MGYEKFENGSFLSEDEVCPLLFDTPLKAVTNALASEISQPEYTGNSLDMALLSGKGLFLKITFFPRYCPPPPTQ